MKSIHLFVLSTWFLGNMAIHFITPYLPYLSSLKHSNVHLAQMMVSFFFFGKALSLLFWGAYSEYFGRRPLMLSALLLFVGSCLLLSLQTDMYVMLGLRFLQGVAVGGTLLMGRAMINDVAKSPVRSFGYLFTLAGIVIPLLPLLGSYMAKTLPYRHMFQIMSAYPFFILIIMSFYLPETLKKKRKMIMSIRTIASDFFSVSKNTLFLSCLFISAFMIAGESAFNTSASFILMVQMHLPKSSYGLVITALGVAHLLGTFSCAQAVKAFDAYRLIGIGVACLAISSILMAFFSPHLGLFNLLAPMIIYYFGTGFIISTTLVATIKPFPKKKATALGFSLFLQTLVSGLFSFVVSFFAIQTVKGLALVLILTSFSALFIFSKKLRLERSLLNA